MQMPALLIFWLIDATHEPIYVGSRAPYDLMHQWAMAVLVVHQLFSVGAGCCCQAKKGEILLTELRTVAGSGQLSYGWVVWQDDNSQPDVISSKEITQPVV